MSNSIWYTRCPIPTASGLAFQRDMFTESFAGTDFSVHNIAELGPDAAETHFDHTLENSFREGGNSPAFWAKSFGSDTCLLGVTYVEEALSVYVRTDSDIQTVADLSGKKLALPVWPELRINFFRFVAQKGFLSALAVHDIDPSSVHFVDILEKGSHTGRINLNNKGLSKDEPPTPYWEQMQALFRGDVDACFFKAGGAAKAERIADGKMRPIYDLRQCDNAYAKINNATPRLLTGSAGLMREHPDMMVRYVQTLVRAAKWAQGNVAEAKRLMAMESDIQPDDIDRFFDPSICDRLVPDLSDSSMAIAEQTKAFLLDHGFLPNDYSLTDWAAPDILQAAYEAENLSWAA